MIFDGAPNESNRTMTNDTLCVHALIYCPLFTQRAGIQQYAPGDVINNNMLENTILSRSNQ